MSEHQTPHEGSSGSWAVRWSRGREIFIKSDVELENVLDDLHSQFLQEPEPVLAEIEAPNGDSLAIGLGREWSVLNFIGASREPPYFTSLGDSELIAEKVAVFRFGDDWTEIPSEHLIPTSIARDAVRDFFQTSKMPGGIQWSQD